MKKQEFITKSSTSKAGNLSCEITICCSCKKNPKNIGEVGWENDYAPPDMKYFDESITMEV